MTPPPLQSSVPQLLSHSKYTVDTSPQSPVVSPPLSTTQLPITQGDSSSQFNSHLPVAGSADEHAIDRQANVVIPSKRYYMYHGVKHTDQNYIGSPEYFM